MFDSEGMTKIAQTAIDVDDRICAVAVILELPDSENDPNYNIYQMVLAGRFPYPNLLNLFKELLEYKEDQMHENVRLLEEKHGIVPIIFKRDQN